MTAEKIGRGLQSVCEWNGAVGIENGLRMERGVLICGSSAKENRQTDCMCSERLLYILYVQTDRQTGSVRKELGTAKFISLNADTGIS